MLQSFSWQLRPKLIAPPLIKILFIEDRDKDGIPEELPELDISEDFTRIG